MTQDVALLTQWRERLKRQEESGVMIDAFCDREGVSTSMFYRWRRHLQDPSAAPAVVEVVDATQRAGRKRSGPPRRKRAKVASAGVPATERPPEFLRLPVRSVQSIP